MNSFNIIIGALVGMFIAFEIFIVAIIDWGENTNYELKNYKMIIGVFLTVVFIMLKVLAVMTMNHEEEINRIRDEIYDFRRQTDNYVPMDIETRFESRDRRITSRDLCDNL